MKLALLIGLTLDKQSGKAITELAPFDQTLKKFKEMVNRGEAPSDRFPVVQLWTTSGLGKSHQFKPSQMPVKVSAKAKAEADAKAKAEADAKAKAEADAKAKAEAEVLRAKAAEVATTAVEARRVADEAKGQPGVAALREAAEAAEEAARQAKVDADAAEAALK